MSGRYICLSCLQHAHQRSRPVRRHLPEKRWLGTIATRTFRSTPASDTSQDVQLGEPGAFFDLSQSNSAIRTISTTAAKSKRKGLESSGKKSKRKGVASSATNPIRKIVASSKGNKRELRAEAEELWQLLAARQRESEQTAKTEAQEQWLKSKISFMDSDSSTEDGRRLNVAKLDPAKVKTVPGADASLTPLHVDDVHVPRLSYDLQRVLFNPGIYQLRDPRSRVYNFDPYLEKIMPVTEFDFEALNEYVTSSQDSTLHNLAVQHDKKYIGSSSSMTSILSHFHFLLSAFRELNFETLSKGFKTDNKNFTRLTMSPSAVFLRYKDGVYATDADKEFDEANILMSMGKSVEKLLTLDKDDFEKYRKSASTRSHRDTPAPEQYHYGTIGNFLMRSQLDAHDPRLPGSGMFDLKTRAVAAIRMYLSDHEMGQGYQIKERFGTWESFEREYHDMMRSAFLKYSLQVRMGRMDGIFVAYHNIERMFGFQYISLPEMDLGLHGQSDTTLGNREFGFSVRMLEDIFDRATQKFPKQTLRFYFEARQPTEKLEPVTYMNVFAEPISDEDADKIQADTQRKIEAFEKRIFSSETLQSEGEQPVEKEFGQGPDEADDAHEEALVRTAHDTTEDPGSLFDAEAGSSESAEVEEAMNRTEAVSSAADSAFLDSLADMEVAMGTSEPPASAEADVEEKPRVGYKLVVRHEVNGQYVGRPEKLTGDDTWSVDYTIEEMTKAQARAKYTMCRRRREVALRNADKGKDDWYINRLISMSDEGRRWRNKLDEQDAQKERVVLYGVGEDGKQDVQQRVQE